MAIELIAGPPNSGRAGEIRRRLLAVAGSEPLLVVPTVDDVARFERELCSDAGALIGVEVVAFDRLIGAVATTLGTGSDRALTELQRERLITLAIAGSELERLRLERAGPSARLAVAEALDEIEGAGLGPTELAAAGSGSEASEADAALLADLGRILGAYERSLSELGRGDSHRLATATVTALRSRPGGWRRPVFVYGFDDFTAGQLALLDALAESVTVTIAVTFEDRPALAARAGLLSRLREGRDPATTTLEPTPAHTRSNALFQLERRFLEPPAETAPLDDGIAVIETAGERAEAETIATEIAGLLAGGVAPEEIAVALRSPDRLGPLYDEVLRACGVPAAVNASVAVTETATGRALLGLHDAICGSGGVQGLLAFVRCPGIAWPEDADWLEHRVRRERITTAEAALEHWGGRALWEAEALREHPGPAARCAALARIAASMAAGADRRQAAQLDAHARREARAAVAIRRAAGELAELGALAPAGRELAGTLEPIRVSLWRGPAAGRVLVGSPYRLRGSRFRHVFCASLQEGEFPAAAGGATLLSDGDRAALHLPPRADARDEERYLFYVCLSRPSERLWLSWRNAAEDGTAASPSPFLGEVAEVFGRLPDPVARRGPGDPAPPPQSAPTETLLARSLAGAGDPAPALAALGIGDPAGSRIRERLAKAAQRGGGDQLITDEHVLAAIRERNTYGARTLEEYTTCPYRWFVSHELKPGSLDPDPEPMTQGSIVHAVLEHLYREPPGTAPLPAPGELAAWRERADELLEAVCAEYGYEPADAVRRAALARARSVIHSFIATEAGRGAALAPAPALLEARFGPDTEVGALELGPMRLRGIIDRVDVGIAGGREVGLIRDYKLSTSAPSRAELSKQGKLQLQLYMLALRELFGIEPAGGLYEPLGSEGAARPRGVISAELAGAEGSDTYGTDKVDAAGLEAELEAARDQAVNVAEAIAAGRIPRDPIGGKCPRWCGYAPICRRERGGEDPAEAGDEGEEGR